MAGQSALPYVGAWLIAIGVILVSIAFPLGASPRLVMLLVGAIFAGATIVILGQWPQLGLLALVITSLTVPAPPLPGGLNAAVLLLALLVGLWLLDLLSRRHIRLVSSRTVPPLLAFAAVSVTSFIVGQRNWFRTGQHAPLDTQMGALAIFVLAAGVFLLVAHQINHVKWLQRMTWLYLLIAAIGPAGWLVPWLVRGYNNRILQLGTMNNSLFWLWIVALTCSQALYNDRLQKGWRLALGALCLATLYVVFGPLNDWKSGYIPAVAAIGVIVAARSWRVGLVLGLLGIIPMIWLANQAVATDEYSFFSRLDAWMTVLGMVKYSPLLGFGPANYHSYTILFPLRGYYSYFSSHNQYLDIIAQIGFLGLGCFLWFVWELGRLGWQLRERVSTGFARAYVYGALGGLVGMLVSGMLVDWFLPFVYNIGLTGFRTSILAWAFLGGLVAIEQLVQRGELNGQRE
ncbi:MAG: O-antigen ligase family protein [Caldilineaceae bacterium]